MTDPIELFGKQLIETVRDAAIRACDQRLRTSARSVIAKHWRDAGIVESDATTFLIPAIVDSTLFALMVAIDEARLPLSFTPPGGDPVDLAEQGDGELGGWIAGDGWRQAYSRERLIDENGKVVSPSAAGTSDR